ncbi:MAG: NADH-ubiquinone oxidoreductase-F iron-sulfur binding region domain-containing protein, partial [Lentisphaeria bacterium]|nr:NADH-ubiquinone oxidoreductase-F iron-sulfur binding region domain-containing protein [Lentisphaeria bacterium]
ADEGDPGAFMDRAVLEGDPHSVLEAMTIGGYAIGADTGIIYIRAEYPLAITRLRIAIDQARAMGFLGKNIFGSGFDFDIELKYGAGAFVCGEETALIRSVEGRRGEPTVKPPFPAIQGLWKKPTVVNNVETYANVAAIIRKGAAWFKTIGTPGSPGTKVFALAGKINHVGLVEVPMGTTLRDIVFNLGAGINKGRQFKAVQTGGPSGGCIATNNLDTPIDYDTLKAIGSMMGSGGMIVMDEDDCMVDIARFFLEFTCDESCGKCTPCRIGNRRLYEMLTDICHGKGTPQTLVELRNLALVIKDTALCGLGQTSPNPVLSTLVNFPAEYEAHVNERRCPAGVCARLIRFTINEKCVGCGVCAKNCPEKAITGATKKRHMIDQDKCIKCGICFQKCMFQAIDKQ